MLADGLPQAERLLAEAKRRGRAGFYRVVGNAPDAGTVELETIADGRRFTVNDVALSESTDVDDVIPGRVFAIGDFVFIQALGPPLTIVALSLVRPELERRGVEMLTDASETARVGPVGWLHHYFAHLDEGRFVPSELRNSDDEVLIFHEARFAVADGTDLHQALIAHPDIEAVTEGSYSWWREGGLLGDDSTTQLGSIERTPDGITVTTNSVERFERLERRLHAIPGVALEGVHTQRADDAVERKPTDPRNTETAHVEIEADSAVEGSAGPRAQSNDDPGKETRSRSPSS